MQCPVCKVPLTMSERQGFEIVYCSQCRGVWLDRGELDMIIERSTAGQAASPTEPARVGPAVSGPEPLRGGYRTEYSPHERDRHDDHYGYGHGPKRRKNWLADLFD